ncbi:succinyl-CoA synthetase beta chain [Burkholderia pseudomallei 305]|nr:succinyl-CoA synthetase beta chain [Burkholderia pseudomallei 305]
MSARRLHRPTRRAPAGRRALPPLPRNPSAAHERRALLRHRKTT